MLVDTSILIDHLRGRTDATQFLSSMRASPGLMTGVVVAAELLSGARDRREQQQIDRLLSRFHVEPILPADGMIALDLLRRYRLGHGISGGPTA